MTARVLRTSEGLRPAAGIVSSLLVLGLLAACSTERHAANEDARGDASADTAVDRVPDVQRDTEVRAETGSPDAEADGSDGGPIGPDESAAFVAIELPALAEHQPSRVPAELGGESPAVGVGAGIALADVDGDGDLDLFAGANDDTGVEPCVFENTSAAGELRLERRDAWCVSEPALALAIARDVDADGRHELIAASYERAYLLRFGASVEVEALPQHDPPCPIGPFAITDEDADGAPEIIASCQLGEGGDEEDAPPRALAWYRDGDAWVAAEGETPLARNTLGIGQADVDADGWIDLLAITDTFAQPDVYDPDADPGGTYFGCPPGDVCERSERWDPVTARHAHGSYMGLAPFLIGNEQHYAIADIGNPHIVRRSDSTWERVPLLTGPPFEPGDAPPRVTWGVVADDFDDDGDDDLFFSVGIESLLQPLPRDAIPNVVMEQADDGSFSQSERFLFPEPSGAVDPLWTLPRASRGAIQADLDRDGDAELIVLAINGAPRVFEHRSRRTRCTAQPVPRYVDRGGAGFAWRASDDDPWRWLELGGENQISPSPFVLLPAPSGTVRFPSGAHVPVDCGSNHTIQLVEPDWLAVERRGTTLEVRIDAMTWGSTPTRVQATWHEGDTPQQLDLRADGGRWNAALGDARPGSVWLAIDGRAVARWLPVVTPADE